MRRVIKTLCLAPTVNAQDLLEDILQEDLFPAEEKAVVEFVRQFFIDRAHYPSEVIVEQRFTTYNLSRVNGVPPEQVRDLYYVVLEERRKHFQSDQIFMIGREVIQTGLLDTHVDRLLELRGIYDTPNLVDLTNIEEVYNERTCIVSRGLVIGCEAIDSLIGGCSRGTLTTIAGRPGHGKTLLGINVMYINAVRHGHTSLYISLETPKSEIWLYLLARHAYVLDSNRNITHEKIRYGQLTPEEREFVFGRVREDLLSKPGRMIILDETDFDNYSFSGIEKVISQYDREVEGGLYGVFVDYIQLFMNLPSSVTGKRDAKEVGNSYITAFRRYAIKRDKAVIILSQISRDGERRAEKRNGQYSLVDLAELNFLERESFRILTIYSTEGLRISGTARLCLLKNRGGRTVETPVTLQIKPCYYIAGEDVAIQDRFEVGDMECLFTH